MTDRRPIVEVVWLDAASASGWNADPEIGVGVIRSVGYLLYEGDDCIRMAQSIDQTHDDLGDIIVIPMACVQSVNRIIESNPENLQ